MCSPDPRTIHANFSQGALGHTVKALVKHGLRCEEQGRAFVCEGQDVGTLNVLVAVEHAPERLIFSAPFRMRTRCDEVTVMLNRINSAVRMSVATCAQQTLFVDTGLFVPVGGITEREVFDYLRWWSHHVVEVLERVGARAVFANGPSATPPVAGEHTL